MINKMYAMMKYISDENRAKYIETNAYGLDLTDRKEDVIVLDFSVNEEDNVEFTGSTVVPYSKKNNLRWFYYAAAKAQATPNVPTVLTSLSQFYEEKTDDSEENLFSTKEWQPGKNSTKFLRALKNNAVIPVLAKLEEYFTNNFSVIAEQIKNILDSTNPTLNILTIRINDKFIGESEYYKQILATWSKNYYEKYYVEEKFVSHNCECSICNEVKPELWGFVSTFNFYAAKTELAPIAGGFAKEHSVKNYPVCSDCAQELDQAKYLLTNFMSYRFCGFNYFIIPEFILSHNDNFEIMEYFFDDTKIGQFRIKYGENHIVSNDQKEILDVLAQTKNSLNYSLVFWDENQAKFSILLTVDGIFPSQFQEIFEAKRKADSFPIFHNLNGLYEKKQDSDLKFMFENLKVFLPIKSKIYGDYSKSFLEIVGRIFRQKAISYKMIIERFMSIFRRKWTNEDYFRYDIEKVINIIYFLHYLKLIDLSKQNISEVNMEELYARFLEEHEEFLNSDAKRATFLLGVLTQKLLNLQYQERNASPFRKQLNSLKLSPAYIRKLFPQVIEKFEQYGKNYYRKLETAISEILLTAKLEELSNDEISFYFTTGMTLENKFRTEKKDNTNEEE
ncbi:TIGR02556 family CRISPR-associated protein [bacterium]|nr:TIGR02556 family CRISPR-associated protein [bacterium]